MLSAILISVGLFSPAYATFITYDSVLDSNNVLTTAEGYATVWDFNTEGALTAPPGMFTVLDAQTADIASGSVFNK